MALDQDQVPHQEGDERRKQITVLRLAEQQKLMAAGIGDQDPLMWLFIAIALGTGMRHGEILRVR